MSNNNNQPSTTPTNNKSLWIGISIGGLLTLGVIIGLITLRLLKNKNNNKIKK